jgi:hypothetical protein
MGDSIDISGEIADEINDNHNLNKALEKYNFSVRNCFKPLVEIDSDITLD